MNSNNLSEIDSLPMPITQNSLHIARRFSSQQRHPQRQEQVYLNTLAVLAVRDYLTILSIETDLTQCDSWNPAMRLFANAADLYIKGLGKIECRPIINRFQNSSSQTPDIYPVPLEAREERIGYIVVEIDEEEKEARLLGFSPTAISGELVLSKLHSVDDFLVHIEHLCEAKVDLNQWFLNVFNSEWQPFEAVFHPQPQTSPREFENPILSKLGNWFKNVFETGWQNIEQGKKSLEDVIFPDKNPDFAFRSGGTSRSESPLSGNQTTIRQTFPEADVTRAKLIDLGMRLGRTTVALLVAIAQQSDRTVRVHAQLHPAIGDRYLPRNLKLSLISDAGQVLDELESTVQQQCISLEFEVEPGESFSIRLAIDDLSVTENFMV
ncbi:MULTISPECIES: DUF1822 family protein [Microcoleaceae]|uniref:DUF1822 family protein n=1 Tax=Microcoleaceae TaxID=1892252 RepID=UPI001881E65D|nr:DUF1822 family protein [Tychonema sp. LEGE 06208]MBE9163042.1 DUF1822 family protein [Tychonema sp. LEGE 06208]